MPVSFATAYISGFGRTEPQAHAAAAGAEPAAATVTLPGATLDDLWNALTDAGIIGFSSSIHIGTPAICRSGGTRSTARPAPGVQARPMSTITTGARPSRRPLNRTNRRQRALDPCPAGCRLPTQPVRSFVSSLHERHVRSRRSQC